ncbi:unnamed protein product [Ectocarpus sp. 4 AP-2014]
MRQAAAFLVFFVEASATTTGRIDSGTTNADDYDIHVPLSATPLGVNVGHALEILSFRRDRIGELPWVARRGWLAVGDTLVALQGQNMSEFSPREFADAMQRVVESKWQDAAQRQVGENDVGEFITLRVRPGKQPGRASQGHGMYSPMTREEAEQERARWHLSLYTGALPSGTVNVTLAAFGGEADSCAALPVVSAIPEDGCLPLLNAQQVKGAHVLVRRGRCSFLAKALAVSSSGGASVVVVDEGAGRLRMEAEEGQTVGIPVVMVSKLDGEALQKLAASTSRATGKVAATLVINAACFHRGKPAPSPRREISSPLERGSRRLPTFGAGNLASGEEDKAPTEDKTGPTAIEMTAGKTINNERGDASPSSVVTPPGQGEAEVADTPAATEVDAQLITKRGGEENRRGRKEVEEEGAKEHLTLPECRQRSSGQLRGGDLTLHTTAREGRGGGGGETTITVEFLSTLVTGALAISPLNSEEESTTIPEMDSPGSGTIATVAILGGPCDNAHSPHEDEITSPAVSKTKGTTVLLLPPDPACSIESQVRLGEQLGAALLVVLTEASDDADMIAAVSSATVISAFAGGHDGSNGSSAFPPVPMLALGRPGGGDPHERSSDQSTHNDSSSSSSSSSGSSAGQLGGERRFPLGGERESPSNAVDGCPPLTIVVAHDEGKRLLGWVLRVRGGGGGSGSEGGSFGGNGGGVVAVDMVERDEVGKLWGDVVWASDLTNWPKGSKQRRRILNRLRKTHSPEHVGRDGASSRTESAIRWSLVERAYAALQDTDDAGDSTKPSRAHPGVDVDTTEEEDARLNSNSIATFDTEL